MFYIQRSLYHTISKGIQYRLSLVIYLNIQRFKLLNTSLDANENNSFDFIRTVTKNYSYNLSKFDKPVYYINNLMYTES